MLVAAAVAGARAGELLGAGSATVVLSVAMLGFVAALLGRRRPARLALAGVAIALLGSACMQRALNGLEHSPLNRVRDARDTSTIRATIVDDPDGGPYVTRVLARVSRFDGRHAGGRTVLVTAGGDAAGRLRLVQVGDTVEISGWFAPLAGFDARLRWRHAVARFDAVDVLAFDAAPSPLFRVANALRDRILAGGRYLPSTERALVSGFLLGDTRALPRDVEEQFRASGLTHHMAVSGENVAFVLALAGPLLRRLSLSARFMGGLGVLVLFGTMTRWEPSVLRACAMAACSMAALYLGRPTAAVRVLALAVVVLVLADPFLIHSVGFLLSCAASAGIALLASPIGARLRGPRWLREPLAVTVAAQIGVAPILIPVFGSVPLVALPANVLAAPLIGPFTMLGFVTGIAGGAIESWSSGVAAMVQAPTGLLAHAMLRIAEVFSRVPIEVDGRASIALIAGGALLSAARLWSVRRRTQPLPEAPTLVGDDVRA